MKKKLRSFYRQKLRDRPQASLAIVENLFRLGISQWIQREGEAPLVAGFQPLAGEPSLLRFYERGAGAKFAFPKVHGQGLEFYSPPKSQPAMPLRAKPGQGSSASASAGGAPSRCRKPKKGRAKFFRKGAFGLLEPQPRFCSWIPAFSVDAFLIPGLSFDRRGRRLGRGGGFYDRLLQNLSPPREAGGGAASAALKKGGGRRRSKRGGQNGGAKARRGLKIGISYSAHIYEGDLPEEPHDVPMDILITEKFILVPNMEQAFPHSA